MGLKVNRCRMLLYHTKCYHIYVLKYIILNIIKTIKYIKDIDIHTPYIAYTCSHILLLCICYFKDYLLLVTNHVCSNKLNVILHIIS